MSLSIRELLEAGAHFGHQTHRWNPRMRPYIYGARNGIYIINLEITAKLWLEAHQALIETIVRGERVLFVGTKPQAQDLVKEESERAQQLYVNRRWLGGMLTNFRTIKGRIDRLEELEVLLASDQTQKITKKETLSLDKERQKLEKSLHGIKTMSKLPGMVFVVDPNRERIAIAEARKLSIPIVAITDTNCDPKDIDYVVPANDDAIKSIRLFLHAASEACIQGTKAFEERIQEETRQQIEAEKAKKAQEAAESEQEPDMEDSTKNKDVEAEVPTSSERLTVQPGSRLGD